MKEFKNLFLAALVALFCHVASAQPVTGNVVLPSVLTVVSNANVTNLTSAVIPLRGGLRDLSLWQRSVAADAGTSNCVVSWNLSPDGTNFTTTFPLTTTCSLTGTNPVLSVTTISRTNLAGSLYIRPDKVATTQTNNVTTTLWYSFDP